MRVEILKKLSQIEQQHHVTILLAVESGSRAWGFPSINSDYDVRFIYAHEQDWYLSVFEKRDVIELPIDPVFDINGWDLKKALALLRRSNPSLLEWLSSHLIYREQPDLIAPLKQLAQTAFMPRSSCGHYLSMAKNNFSKCKNRSEIKIKAYLYSLRAILCCLWVIEHQQQPPILFAEVLNRYLADGTIRTEIDKLLVIKQSTQEQDRIPRSIVLENYIAQQLTELSSKLPNNSESISVDVFDETFKKTLKLLSSYLREKPFPLGGGTALSR